MSKKLPWVAATAAVMAVGASATPALASSATSRVAASTAATSMVATPTVARENAELAQLYKAALAQSPDLTVYMGGDKVGQWNYVAQAFEKKFPKMKIHLITDLSKYQDARIDLQIANHHQVADVAILQTVQDFTRWAKEGALLRYKPIGYNHIFANAKDPNGYWTGVFYGAFADMVNSKDLPSDPSSFTAEDLLEAKFKHKLVFTYPDDDDAVLYDFKLTIDKYGWGWLKKIMAQDPTFVRGTPFSAARVADGKDLATLGTTGDPSPDAKVVLPADDPFNSWVQHGAIFKDAPHQAAAKLFMSFITSEQFQKSDISDWTWSVRKDVAPPTGLRPLASYKNTNVENFQKFMSNRAAVEEFRQEVLLYVGTPEGPDPADPHNTLGVAPGAF